MNETMFNLLKIFIACLLLFVLNLPTVYGGIRAAYYKERGDQEYTQGRFPIAIDLYKKAIAKNLNYLPALISLGRLLRETEAFKNSRYYLEKAYKIDPKNEQAITELAKTKFKQKDIGDARKLVKKGLKLYPHNPDLNFLQSQIYLMHDRKYLARKKLNHILRSNPGHIPSYILLSEILVKNRQYDKAIKLLKKSYLAKSDEPNILVHISRAKLLKKIDRLENLLFDEPLDPTSFLDILRDLNNANNFDTVNIPANQLLGKIHALTRNCEKALPYFDAILSVNPNHFEAQYYQGYCDDKKSLSIYPRLLADHNNDEVLRYHLEKNLLKNISRRENPKIMRFVSEHYGRGRQLSSLNQESQAFHEFRWASYLFPGHLKSNNELLRYYRSRSDFEFLSNILQFLRRNTGDIKYFDMYEQLTREKRKKISYTAGIRSTRRVKTPTPVFIFYFKPADPFGRYPDAGRAISDTLSFALNTMGRVYVLPQEEQNKIYESILRKNYFGLGGYYNVRLAREVKNKADRYLNKAKEENISKYGDFLGSSELRYVIRGNYKEIRQGLSVNMEIIDLITGLSIFNTRSQAQGRGYLTYLAVNLASKIYENMPFHGKVLKIRGSRVLVNLGNRDGLKKGNVLSAHKGEERIADLSVIKAEMDLSWTVVQGSSYNTFRLQPGDIVRLK